MTFSFWIFLLYFSGKCTNRWISQKDKKVSDKFCINVTNVSNTKLQIWRKSKKNVFCKDAFGSYFADFVEGKANKSFRLWMSQVLASGGSSRSISQRRSIFEGKRQHVWQFFSWKLHKMKKFWLTRGGRTSLAPSRSATGSWVSDISILG